MIPDAKESARLLLERWEASGSAFKPDARASLEVRITYVLKTYAAACIRAAIDARRPTASVIPAEWLEKLATEIEST